MKLLHTADWQLGCPFRGFGDKAERLRDERLQALERALGVARREGVDAFLIAGDLFEDHQVAGRWVSDVCELFGRYPDVPVFLLPGNHDPASGSGSVWVRPPLNHPPAHVRVFREAGACEISGGWLVASPLRQRLSPTDPSLALVGLARALPADSIKVGMTHGALAIEGKHQPSDHPIHLEAATRAGLDYLALGHWHTWQVCDHGRMLMPGTPEPDAFDHAEGRFGALVELGGRGEPPVVRQVELAGLAWETVTCDFGLGATALAALERALEELRDRAAGVVVRAVLRGHTCRAALSGAREILDQRLPAFVAAEVVDETRLQWSEAEIETLRRQHPLLAQVTADLARIRTFATGEGAGVDPGPGALTPAQYRALLEEQHLCEEVLTEQFFKAASVVLAEKLQEIES